MHTGKKSGLMFDQQKRESASRVVGTREPAVTALEDGFHRAG